MPTAKSTFYLLFVDLSYNMAAKKRTVLDLEDKKKLIDAFELGKKPNEIIAMFEQDGTKISKFTISKVLKRKQNVLDAIAQGGQSSRKRIR